MVRHNYIRWLFAYVFYYFGDWFSKIMDCCENDQWCMFWYYPYNQCMVWSNRIQGPSGFGPWEAVIYYDGMRWLDNDDSC